MDELSFRLKFWGLLPFRNTSRDGSVIYPIYYSQMGMNMVIILFNKNSMLHGLKTKKREILI